jgi:AcrR family transcriptional regulator
MPAPHAITHPLTDLAVTRPGGRTARIRAAVLDATVAALIEHGYASLTVDDVAARAGVNKTTLYRRWGGRARLVFDAVETYAVAHADVPDTGNIDEDLRRWARSIQRMLTGTVSGPLVRAVFSSGDSADVQPLRERFWLSRLALARGMVERAILRGELPPGTDTDDMILHVGAPLYYRLLVLAQPLDIEAADLAAAVTAAAAKTGVFVRRPTALSGGEQ